MKTVNEFILYYNETLRNDPLFLAMAEEVEGSPWHREANVRVHTDMVVNQMLTSYRLSEKNKILGLLSCAFHDVGKPPAMEVVKTHPTRGVYKRFKGHEILSSRLWVDYALRNFSNMSKEDIYKIAWMIEYHLPFDIKKPDKVNNLVSTICYYNIHNTFLDAVEADQLGRIADDPEEKIERFSAWKDSMQVDCNDFLDGDRIQSLHEREGLISEGKRACYVLIGPSGAGKSTFAQQFDDCGYHSMDTLRCDLYPSSYDSSVDRYKHAFRESCEDSDFRNKVTKHFISVLKDNHRNVVVDNLNLTKKSRNQYITEARRKGYAPIGVVFFNTLEEIMNRRVSRSDKYLDEDIVFKQYMRLQMPLMGEFDKIIFV